MLFIQITAVYANKHLKLYSRVKAVLLVTSLRIRLARVHLFLLILAQLQVLTLDHLFLRLDWSRSWSLLSVDSLSGRSNRRRRLGSSLLCGVHQGSVIVEQTLKHGATVLLGKHEVDGVQGPPKRQGHPLTSISLACLQQLMIV